MQPFFHLSTSHSNESGGEIGAQKRGFGAIRQIVAVAALLGLLVAGRYVIDPEPVAIDRSTFYVAVDFTLTGDVGATSVQHATILYEFIELLKDLIDILDGKTPLPPRDPESPEPAPLDQEEIDEANDAVDGAEDEGVDVPEERVEASWNYNEVRTFLSLVVNRIEEFVDSQQ